MSYILDALNKSDQDRKKQLAPDLATVHRRHRESTGSRNRWLWSLALITAINLAALAYWQYHQQPGTGIDPVPVSQAGKSAVADPKPADSAVADSVVVNAAEKSPPAKNNQSTPAEVMTPPLQKPQSQAQQSLQNERLEPGEVLVTPDKFGNRANLQAVKPVRISELPINIQRQIPDLKFSSHLYSNDFRMVNINGKMTREGDTIAQGLKLVEITEEGVVLSYLHYTFEMSVLRDWAFD